MLLLVLFTSDVFANPSGLTVQNGSASVTVNGNQYNITASHNAFLNWQSFNIAPGETTRFIQPSASSVVWNRINDANPSQIYGNLTANGIVVLMNQNGFYFGPNSFVSAAGLIVSTAPFVPAESGGGLFWQFTGPPPNASIINYGQIYAGPGGSAFLIADHIENHGSIHVPGGNIGLLAGQNVFISERPDGRGLSASVTLPSGSVNNSGELIADAGTIALNARVVNQNGLVQANSIRERNGIVELIASDSMALGPDSIVSANGDSTGVSDGGEIIIKSGDTFTDEVGSKIEIKGGTSGGYGGFVEVSAPSMNFLRSQISGSALAGHRGGRLLIDPEDIYIKNSGDSPVDGALNLDTDSAFVGLTEIHLQATHTIKLAADTVWNLEDNTGLLGRGGQLTLEVGNLAASVDADGNLDEGSGIIIGDRSRIVGGAGWLVNLIAGRDFTSAGTVTSGRGYIRLEGAGAIETQDGNINLLAGKDLTVNSGFVRTVGGGSIAATALGGSINTGTKANGFTFSSTGYTVHADLGGISTANGGNVNLTAGLDVENDRVRFGSLSDGGSGAFGAAPGNVTIIAGRNVTGHYVVRNGVGSITAGANAGVASDNMLALSLVSGGWTVNAVNDIWLQEVRNPNGVFNSVGSSSSPNRFRFDYSPDAYTRLHAGHAVQLRGTPLPRPAGFASQNIPPIYPGTLEITAGAGGVVLGNDLILFPSPLGDLRITTTDGGSLIGTKNTGITQLIVSDSGKTRIVQAGDLGLNDHAATPIHLNDTDPITLNIDGDMSGIHLGIPKRAEVNVGGDMVNSRFDGQNLHNTDETRITVAGDILNRNEFTTVPSSEPNFRLFDPLLNLIYPPLASGVAGIENKFFYNKATGEVTFQGKMSGAEFDALKNLTVRVFNEYGMPEYLPNGEPKTKLAEFVSAAVLQRLYDDSQNVVPSNTGYRIGGGGTFTITARNLDLGATAGIASTGPSGNTALANYFTRGADINVVLSGNLDMFSTKIASVNGGNINIYADGDVTAGSRTFNPGSADARGIFTLDESDIAVIARGDINVNGSRIAAYDGGNILVRSLEGDVDAGTGGTGAAQVQKVYVDPTTRAIRTSVATIPGSGILATTFPPSLSPLFPRSQNTVGDILVEAPRGDIIASSGGVVQVPLNVNGEDSSRKGAIESHFGGFLREVLGIDTSKLLVVANVTSAGTVRLRAGSRGEDGNVTYVGNIDASGSGVIGSTVKLEATGDIKGLVFARDNLDIDANQNVNVTALAVGNANVSAGDTVSGTIVGVGSVSASGSSVDASLLSQNVTASGDVTSSQVGFAQANVAGTTSQGLQADDSAKEAASGEKREDEEDELKKNRPGPRIAKTTGRVTVILPDKKS